MPYSPSLHPRSPASDVTPAPEDDLATEHAPAQEDAPAPEDADDPDIAKATVKLRCLLVSARVYFPQMDEGPQAGSAYYG